MVLERGVDGVEGFWKTCMPPIWTGEIRVKTLIRGPMRLLGGVGGLNGVQILPEVLLGAQLELSSFCATNAYWAQRWHQRLLTPWTTA